MTLAKRGEFLSALGACVSVCQMHPSGCARAGLLSRIEATRKRRCGPGSRAQRSRTDTRWIRETEDLWTMQDAKEPTRCTA
jgi:hypothetical protein